MKARVLNVDSSGFVAYMVEGSELIYEMKVTAAMMRVANEGWYGAMVTKDTHNKELPITLVGYHDVAGRPMKASALVKLCENPSLAPLAMRSYLRLVHRPLEKEEIYRFTPEMTKKLTLN